MKRIVESQILAWKNKSYRLPLILQGAGHLFFKIFFKMVFKYHPYGVQFIFSPRLMDETTKMNPRLGL